MHLSTTPQQKNYAFDCESEDYGTVQVEVEIKNGDWARFTAKAAGVIVWGMSHRGYVLMSQQDETAIQDKFFDILETEKQQNQKGYHFFLVLLQH